MNVKRAGWICLDIDGTMTDELLTIPKPLLNYLIELHQNHWQIAIVTGRGYSLASKPLDHFNIPYYLVPHNGASAYEMPSKKLMFKKYLPLKKLRELDKVIHSHNQDYVVYTGLDQGEHAYYRPQFLNPKTRSYFEEHLNAVTGNWRAVESFSDLTVDDCPYGKIYGDRKTLENLEPHLQKIDFIKTHLVYDSINPNFSILQMMDSSVDKGNAVRQIIDESGACGPIISAGNDNNDEALLQIADVRIAMHGSPKSLIDQAHIIAPPVEEMGLLSALKLAVSRI